MQLTAVLYLYYVRLNALKLGYMRIITALNVR